VIFVRNLGLALILPALSAILFSGCSSAPSKTIVTNEYEMQNKGLRYPASEAGDSVEMRFCSAISKYNISLAKANHPISPEACQELISRNASVCDHFNFCNEKGFHPIVKAQHKTKANQLIAALNQNLAGPERQIRDISNRKFRNILCSSEDRVGFHDLEKIIAESSY